MLDFAVCVAWHNQNQRDEFLKAWNVPDPLPPWLFLQQDKDREGGAVTKNKAMRRAVEAKTEIVISLDDDCFPVYPQHTLEGFSSLHALALEPQKVRMFDEITSPPSRGTPYFDKSMMMPVAASMGFWMENGDHCAARQLAFNNKPMTFKRKTITGRYFPLCGMNYAFRPAHWQPWCYLLEGVGRFDDIWMGWLWQREAYRRGFCFNLAGPLVRHSRQSNVWANLRDEARLLEENETMWRRIAVEPYTTYDDLKLGVLRKVAFPATSKE